MKTLWQTMISVTLEIGLGELTCAFILTTFEESHLDLKEMMYVVSVPSLSAHLFVRLVWNIVCLPFECLQCAELC